MDKKNFIEDFIEDLLLKLKSCQKSLEDYLKSTGNLDEKEKLIDLNCEDFTRRKRKYIIRFHEEGEKNIQIKKKILFES